MSDLAVRVSKERYADAVRGRFQLRDSMARGFSCVLLVAAGLLGCSDSGSSSDAKRPAASELAVEKPVRGARSAPVAPPGQRAKPDVPAALLAELANQSLPSLEEASRITEAFGEFLKTTSPDGQRVLGASVLPEEKASIRGALFRIFDSSGTEDQREFMRAALRLLAYFQDDIEGSATLDAIAPNGQPFREIVETEVTAVTYELARRHGVPN